MKFEIDVLHTFPLPSGSEVDGAQLGARAFVSPGRHSVDAEQSTIEQLDASGYVEILTNDGVPVIWPACCCGCVLDHEI